MNSIGCDREGCDGVSCRTLVGISLCNFCLKELQERQKGKGFNERNMLLDLLAFLQTKRVT